MMDKNEAWKTMVAGINCPDVAPTETIALIQLDAFKAGMTRAADIIKQSEGAIYGLTLIQKERDSL